MNDLADILSRVAGLRVCVGTRCKCDAGHEWVSAHGDCVWFQMPHCPVCHKPATSQRGEWQTLAEHAAERPVTVIDPAKVPAEDLTKVLAEEFVKGVKYALSVARREMDQTIGATLADCPETYCRAQKEIVDALESWFQPTHRPPLGTKWCMCLNLAGVLRDCFSTCTICGGVDAYGKSNQRPPDKMKDLDLALQKGFSVIKEKG